MRTQNGMEDNWEIFLFQAVLFAQCYDVHNDVRNSDELKHQDFALFFVLFYFLVKDPSEYGHTRGSICSACLPHVEYLE